MNVTIKGSGRKVKLDEEESEILMSALYQFMSEHWNDNFVNNEDEVLSKKLGLIQWIGNVFE